MLLIKERYSYAHGLVELIPSHRYASNGMQFDLGLISSTHMYLHISIRIEEWVSMVLCIINALSYS